MSRSGPPAVPPDPSGPPRPTRRREVSDWDWGDGWDVPAPRRRGERRSADDASAATAGDGRRGARAGDTDARDRATGTGDGATDAGGRATHAGDHATGPDDRTAGAEREPGGATVPSPEPPAAGDGPAPPGPRPRRRPRARRRPRRAVLVALLLAAVGAGVVALASGGDDAPAGADHARVLGRHASTASSLALDRLERAAAVERYARIGRPVYCGAGRKPWVALTFDDGPGELSPKFVSLLSQAGAPATVFRIGRNVPGREEAIRVQRALGWDAGTHTQSHPFLGKLSATDQRAEIEAGNRASRGALGRPAGLFRPPYESHDAKTDRIVQDLGMVEVLWNVDTQDALGATTADQIAETAIKGLHPGSIILMHEVKPNTLAALPRILAAMRERGLRAVTVSQMLAGDGPSEQQLRRGYDGCRVDLTPGKAAS